MNTTSKELASPVDLAIPERKSKVISLQEAGRIIAEQRIIHIGNQQPLALVRAAIKANAKNLTLIPTVSASMAVDLFIAAGCVKELYISYLGFEGFGFAPAFRDAAQNQSIHVIEGDEAFIVQGTRAAAGGLPFIPIRGVYEANDLPRLNPLLKKTRDPFTNSEVFAIPPLHGDVCIVHAQECDEYGNAQCWGGNLQEVDKAMASKIVIVSTERIVSVDRTREAPEKVTLPGHMVHAVVHAPFGAHPLVCARSYEADNLHLQQYFAAHKAGSVETYLQEFIYGTSSHAEYLEKVGIERVMSLIKNI